MSDDSLAERAEKLDEGDELAGARRRFVLEDGIVYLDGNSLGPLGTAVAERVRQVVEVEWGERLAAGWSECGWMDLPGTVGDRVAPLIGARGGEVLVADTTTVALGKLLGAALKARPGRHVVLSSRDNFPSDLYVAGAVATAAGFELKVVERDEVVDAIEELGEALAVCYLTQVDFRTGALYDLAHVSGKVHDAGALSFFDLCHSAGAVVVDADANGIDLAVGCSYKYLNGGPGAPSFLYVRRELQEELENPLPGWLGHDTPFGFDLDWRAASGIRRFLTSTPPVLALSALDAALDVFDGFGIETIRQKSCALGDFFIEAVDELSSDNCSLEVASPRDSRQRGSQVSLRHREASAVIVAGATRGVLGDFRPPDVCRFGLSPLYLSFSDVLAAARIICEVARSLG